MPRKSTKKETTPTESKAEGTTRRSGRSVTKQEPAAGKEASRSRRSSTAAQTAASAADTKSPKGRSSSPAESRQKTRRESAEPRAKSARRAASQVNYKESDGEEEVVEKKFDEAFESNEEFEDSESDEKSKPKGRARGSKTPVKGRGAKGKGKGRSPRSRRGRPAKKQSSDEEEDEEMEAIELSEDSVEIDEVKKSKETTRSSRGRKSKADESTKESDDKPKSRRSARAAVVREESPRKRPTRGVQAKKYTEDDDDIEEIDDAQEEDKPDGSRKRKRGPASDSNKRLKEDDESEEQKVEADAGDKDDDMKHDPVSEKGSENTKSKDEPMEVDEKVADKDDSEELSPSAAESKNESKESESKSEDKPEAEESVPSKEKSAPGKKQESAVSSEVLDESMQSFDSDQGSRPEQLSGLDDSQDVKESKPVDSGTGKAASESQLDSANSVKEADASSESKKLTKTDASKEQNVATVQGNAGAASKIEKVTNDVSALPDTKASEKDNGVIASVVTHSKEAAIDNLNGSEKSAGSAPVGHSGKSHTEEAVPTANGAHDSHTNSNSESDQYYPLPGRKYVVNAKLGESIRQSVKDKSFGFVSYNLGLSSSDSSIQKEKLLNEFNKLDAHIICIQQVPKSLYAGILEPSLDALGFKGTFSQPEGTESGIATFYKSSLFRLSGQTETSLKHLIEKELESAASLEPNERLAVKSHIKKCGHVLFTHFATVIGTHSLTVANVQIPPTDLSIHALQVSCLAREVVTVNGDTSKPFLLGGEFNMLESEAPYQLLRDGYLSNDMIDVLQRKEDVQLPGKENGALINLLWKFFQHSSSTLCSCYKSVLDHEVFIPGQKTTSPDLLWYNCDSLYTVGVVDAAETAGTGRHFSLKADVAFSMF